MDNINYDLGDVISYCVWDKQYDIIHDKVFPKIWHMADDILWVTFVGNILNFVDDVRNNIKSEING